MVWNKEKAKEVIQILRKEYPIKDEEYVSLWAFKKYRDLFKVLIATILSQSSTDKSAMISFKNLDEKIGVDEEKLAIAKVEEIEEAIKHSGLQKQKAKAIKEIAKLLSNTNLEDIFKESYTKARDFLISLPKVGEKTADVMLALYYGNTIPIDTHVERVSKRLGIAENKDKYSEIKRKLEEIFEENRHDVHLLFIAHGRKICRARNPLCDVCKISSYCEYFKNLRQS